MKLIDSQRCFRSHGRRDLSAGRAQPQVVSDCQYPLPCIGVPIVNVPATDSPFSCALRLLNEAGARQLVPVSLIAVSVWNAPVGDSREAKSKTKSRLRRVIRSLPKPKCPARFEMNAEKRSG